MYADPPELAVGQLSESWEELTRMLRERDDVLVSGLVWLGGVLGAIGHAGELPPVDAPG